MMETQHGTTYREVLESNYGKLPAEETIGDAAIAREKMIEALGAVCDGQDLVLKCNELNYMTLFKNSDANYVAEFLNDTNNFEACEFPGVKHFEVSGVGVSILVGENTYFLFPTKLIEVDCTDGFYPESERVDYEKECTR